MKKLFSLTVTLFVAAGLLAQNVQYPFQDTKLSDDERIDNVISLMELPEKLLLFGGAGIPRLGIAAPGSVEAIHGAVMSGNPADSHKYENYSTAFPQGYGLGETWDKGALRTVGETMAAEVRYYSATSGRNSLVLWAPNADIARDPRWGRTEESLGEDAFLVGTLAGELVKGIQGPDERYWAACSLMKHFLANSNEDNRASTSSDFSKKLFHEYYSYGFYKGVQSGASSLMLAYNAWNGVPCTCNPYVFKTLHGWGMKGQLITDAGGYSGIVNAHKYMDDLVGAAAACVKCGISRYLDKFQPYVDQALEKGLIDEGDIDKAIRGNVYVMLKLGLLDAPGTENPYSTLYAEGDQAPWLSDEFKTRALDVTRKSVVLLKNDKHTLPIDIEKVTKIAVIGDKAEAVIQDWYGAKPSYTVNALQGIRKAVEGKDVEVRFLDVDHDGSAERLAAWADVAIVVTGNHPVTSPDWGMSPWAQRTKLSEGREAIDRQGLELDSEDLVKIVHRANPNTVVALISSFPYAINWTAENVPAIVHMTQCSQELGTALADVIFGKYNPAGRTNQTWVKSILDLPNMLDYDITRGRTYMYFKGEPLFAFGHGLSYTSFEYRHLSVEPDDDGGLKASVEITNTGDVDGEEVVQLYVKFSGDDAAMRLKGFERVAVPADRTVTVNIPVSKTDLSLWDEEQECWKVAAGKVVIKVGAASDDIRLIRSIRLGTNQE
ncbi:MAG: glycoside hydrolase family 3 C-terminal domain-containing protein [Bacteroidales bacterium]|nr:glycoside hydrolase family 3 C-terminal domain-containing protein [Candidatus Hennigimonas equi]